MVDFQSFLIEELNKTKTSFNSEFQVEIGINIKKLRLSNNITQKQLSKLSGISQSKISQIENGSLNMTISTLERIYDVLGYKAHITEEKK